MAGWPLGCTVPENLRPIRRNSMQSLQRTRTWLWLPGIAAAALLLYLVSPSLRSQAPPGGPKPEPEKSPLASSYDQVSPVLLGQQTFAKMMATDKGDKQAVLARHKA